MAKIPILKLGDILLSTIQIDLTDQDALVFQDDLLTNVKETNAEGVIIDITGLDVVDSFMARVINDTANMAHILGAEVVLCGMRPDVALALIEMGRQLIGVETALNLQEGMEKLISIIEGKRK